MQKLDLKKIAHSFGRYKYVVIVILVGALLLLLPASGEREEKTSESNLSEEDFSVHALEEQLEEILAEIEGAGRVNVMLTVESGMKRVFAQDGRLEQESQAVQSETQTVVIASGSGKEETVLIQQIYPRFMGALIVAEGGSDPSIRLKLTEAVAALTGLGADKISVCKGK